MDFTKIKYKPEGKVELKWEQENNSGELDEYQMKSAEQPSPSFSAALNDLVEDVLNICELPEGYRKGMTVTGVSLSYTDGILGATITASKVLEIANTPLVINTPHLPEAEYAGEDTGAPLLPVECVDRLNALFEQAERYINGKRRFKSLFEEENGDSYKGTTGKPAFEGTGV